MARIKITRTEEIDPAGFRALVLAAVELNRRSS